jgi:hypothetical protein
MDLEGVVHNGVIVPDDASVLPEGTRVRIIPASLDSLGVPDDGWTDTPEAAEAWIRAYDALEPVEFTPQERAAWNTASITWKCRPEP